MNKRFKILENEKFLGVLSRSFSFTDEPKMFNYTCSSIDKNSSLEGSASDFDEKKAKIKALGEYVERYCLDNPTNIFKKRSYKEGVSESIDPSIFLNFRNEDINGLGVEYTEKVINSKLEWVLGTNILTEKEIYLPAQLVYINHPFSEPMIRPRISTGASSHINLERALISGIMENIERDSYVLTYFTKRKVPRVSLDGELKGLKDYFERYKLELAVFETTTDLEIPSFMCLNLDRTGMGPAISVGLGANLNPIEAIKRSISESQQVRQWIRYKYVAESMPNVKGPEDFRQVEDRGYYWYPRERINELGFLLDNSSGKKSSEYKKRRIKTTKELSEFLRSKGVESYFVDIGNEITKNFGFEVVKVVQPQLQPLFLEENLPCLEGERIRRYSGNSELNKIPHPFI